jgi:hypothetical protein
MPRRATSTSYGAGRGNERGPGNRSGPVPATFKMRMQTLVDRNTTARAIERILEDPDHPHFMRALDYATNHGYGKPAETVDLNATGTLTLKVERE